MRDEQDGDPHVQQQVEAGGDAYVAGRDMVVVHWWPLGRRLTFSALGLLAVTAMSVTAWQLVAATAPSSQPTPRTQREWAADVNAECRLTEPTLDTDIKAVTDLPPSAFVSVPIDPRIPKALERLTADEAEITHLFRQVFPAPSSPDAAVKQWLSALSDRDLTLSKATKYSQEISTDSSLLSY